jgi:hypothetical protein
MDFLRQGSRWFPFIYQPGHLQRHETGIRIVPMAIDFGWNVEKDVTAHLLIVQ